MGTGEIEVVWIRHGRTEANATRRIVGALDPSLDEVGHAQAAALAASWPHGPFHELWTSPLLRARQTAAALGQAPRVDPALAEMNQGVLEGLSVEEALQRHAELFRALMADPERTAIPGGESMGEVRDRAVAALDRIGDAAPEGGRVVVVTHLMVVASVACHAAGLELRAWRQLAVDNVGARVVVGRPGAWRLAR